jgi:hypothetical protein
MASASSTVDEEEDDEDEEDEEEEEDVAASLTKESGGLGLRMSRRMEYICFGGRCVMWKTYSASTCGHTTTSSASVSWLEVVPQ